MADYSDLEISIQRHGATQYVVDWRLSQSGSDADIRPQKGALTLAQFETSALGLSAFDPAGYGKILTQGLFSNPDVRDAFVQARKAAQALNSALRLRLFIGESAPELHSLHWETLRDPESDAPLFTGEQVLFSRYLASRDWRPVRLQPKGELKALLAAAGPKNLGDFELAPIDAAEEINRILPGLERISLTRLDGASDTQRASLENIANQLRQGQDIFFLVCHGTLKDGSAWLWLEDEQGLVKRVSGEDLVQRISEIENRPRLIVLVSCQSAGNEEGSVLASLGPRLAEAGVPAVIAMQGNLSQETAKIFMPAFFQELQRDGQIDRAVSVARGMVRNQADFWMPALFMRLRSGRIWYVPGFGDQRKGMSDLRFLIRKMEEGACTPILGPGLNETFLGTQAEIARNWAKDFHYPMELVDHDSLPQVAQYLMVVTQYDRAPYDELVDYLKKAIRNRYSDRLSQASMQRSAKLDDLILEIGKQRRDSSTLEPYRVLASLPLPVFITANYDNLLFEALVEANKDPQVALCPWNEAVEKLDTIFNREPGYEPKPERPLVYHLFGRISEPESVVLTEDDYFKFLIGVTSNTNLIPPIVLGRLVDSALLMLGFRVDDWQFRVLFHSLLNRQGDFLRGSNPHIAAQIGPEDWRTLDPQRAREYIEKYYAPAKISIYWGSVDDFIQDLSRQWTT